MVEDLLFVKDEKHECGGLFSHEIEAYAGLACVGGYFTHHHAAHIGRMAVTIYPRYCLAKTECLGLF